MTPCFPAFCTLPARPPEETLSPTPVDKDERPVVVTSEAARITVYWTDAAGRWKHSTRAHVPIEAPVERTIPLV
jgi:hypothetical protein